jgi:hypothetical protein
MKESAQYLLNKIPKKFIIHYSIKDKTLLLDDEETDCDLYNNKVKYWVINLENNHGFIVDYQ